MIPATIEGLQAVLDEQDYIADESLTVAIHLALQLGRPLFLEGAQTLPHRCRAA